MALLTLAGCLFALVTPRLGVAQDATPTLRIAKDNFHEELVPRTQVSGNVRVGVLAGELVSSVDPARLVIRIPAAAAGRLCIDLRSANGEYHGRIQRSLEGIGAGDYRVDFPTEKTEFFRARGANEIAVLAFTAADCLAAPQMILPASWSGGIDEDGFWVFINANRNRASISATDGAGHRRDFPCEPAPVEIAVIYDLRCFVALPRNGEHKFRIERRPRGLGNRLAAVNLPVHW